MDTRYRLWARQHATAQVTEGEYAVNTSKENTTPPSAATNTGPIGADKQLMFKQ